MNYTRAFRIYRRHSKAVLLCCLLGVVAQQLPAQTDPWSHSATVMAQAFTGPIVRGFALVAIVLGGLGLAFSEGTFKRTIGGIIFGLAMALSASSFLSWITS